MWLSVVAAFAQPTVAPTDAEVGIPRGDNVSGYNIRQSWEVGYRYRTVGGNEGMYRSTVNFGNGVRLLGSSLSVNSLEGHGHYFDLIQLNTQGLGNDPYQNAVFRIEKNRLYRYDLNWRSNAYYNPSLRISGGEHAIDTVRNWQSHDFTLFPQARTLKLFLGYSRNTQSGPALTTIQLFDPRGDEFPLFADVRRQQNEYRAGFELGVMGWRLNLLHSWVDFKDDTPVTGPALPSGNSPDDLTALDNFQRAQPYHGRSPFWRIALFKESPTWAFNGRFTYVAGQRSFVSDETSVGTNRFGAATARQIVTLGDAQRPAATGNATFSLFPHDRITVVNQTSVYNIRMVGNSYYTQLTNGVPITPFNAFTYLGIFTVANATDLDVRLASWASLRAGYQYSSRRIRSKEDFGGNAPTIEQFNNLHTGLLGLNLQPVRPLTIRLEGEIGRADNPIYPISKRNLQAARARIQWRSDRFRIGGFARLDYNTNSASLANFASRARQYGGDFSWMLTNGFYVDATYAKLHLDTLGAINYFANTGGAVNELVTGNQSYYVSNLHTGAVALRFVAGRAEMSLGGTYVQDTGGGNRAVAQIPAFIAAQTFPLKFYSPLARISFEINENLRWNVGYQYYGYSEDFSTLQNFRAHTGYASILWSF